MRTALADIDGWFSARPTTEQIWPPILVFDSIFLPRRENEADRRVLSDTKIACLKPVVLERELCAANEPKPASTIQFSCHPPVQNRRVDEL